MSNCIDQQFPCQNPDYYDFDVITKAELFNPPTASQIINESKFCTFIPTDVFLQLDELCIRDYLQSLKGKMGLYHLWIDYDNCDEHDTCTMLCVYVGKGQVERRILNHIREKWPKKEYLYVSFYECDNRIAKYLEQLFLDTYNFHFNCSENSGNKNLFAVWDSDRHLHGTESATLSNIISSKS
ncbi:hypothetical protein F917_00275 [Acinetobacter baumannii NIPH 67]|uniref:hypothetical protein n=1 Tax=Acinetobacter baumannii TaxID=470 RepID=UPI0002D0553C|nr:hypothetical protein [Acinetobacter baumannii]ENW53958.1 hypothetical protein F917_00275 [Acinetobacter baumannii NIPH 67]MBF1880322.1 hypothetical protein [Acinetobacter baumannii]HAV4217813.1 hypothetical protein [Acinetobacter baumannii]